MWNERLSEAGLKMVIKLQINLKSLNPRQCERFYPKLAFFIPPAPHIKILIFFVFDLKLGSFWNKVKVGKRRFSSNQHQLSCVMEEGRGGFTAD